MPLRSLASATALAFGRAFGLVGSECDGSLLPAGAVLGLGASTPGHDGFGQTGVRESVYARSLPLATRRLEIAPAQLGGTPGVRGLTARVTDHIFDAARVDAALAGRSVR